MLKEEFFKDFWMKTFFKEDFFREDFSVPEEVFQVLRYSSVVDSMTRLKQNSFEQSQLIVIDVTGNITSAYFCGRSL